MTADGGKICFLILSAAVLSIIVLSAGGGDLEPNAPPGPTMHTLDEIYTAVSGGQEPPQPSAVDMFLQIEGVPGESQDAKHQDWIEVLSWSWGMSRAPIDPSPTMGDISLVKEIDKASPKLALYCGAGTTTAWATFEVCHSDSNGSAYYRMDLEDVIVTSVRPRGMVSGSEPVPVEEVTLNYGTIEWQYVTADGNTILAGWDVNTNTPIDPCGYLAPVVP
jgi:type VI secretion system secreted protein Hcp